MTLARQIAERIHALQFDAITPTALAWVRAAFVDTVGVTLAGMAEDGPRILLRDARHRRCTGAKPDRSPAHRAPRRWMRRW